MQKNLSLIYPASKQEGNDFQPKALNISEETLNSLESALGFYKKSEKIALLVSDIQNCVDIEKAKSIAESIIGEL